MMTIDAENLLATKPRLMTTPTPGSLDLGPCQLVGVSLAGCRTSLYIPELKIGFDAGFPFPFQLSADAFFITHGHLDHASAIPYIVSQKTLNHQKIAHFYMPPELIPPLTEIMNLWQKIELHDYRYEFLPVDSGDQITLNKHYFIRTFKAHHRIPARGYTLFQHKKHLKAELLGQTKTELMNLKKRGAVLDEVQEVPLMTFSGDTQIEFLWEHPWITQAKYLLIETTYLDDRKTKAQARQWGHVHLDELLEVLPKIQAEKIILMHISSRYGDQEALRIVRKRVPEEYRDRIMIFNGR